ncbi:MAG: alpha/beta hydrolase [Candidatus Omnitrophica bacterium]|nr:alpha/beta hydrolase [Candidatus Omnitrophota bacterium]
MFWGCAGTGAYVVRQNTAQDLADRGRLTRTVLPAGEFHLTAFSRTSDPARPLRIYIEGDGYAWVSRSRPSNDPTPIDPVALRLAAADPYPNVVYLARPCQYGSLTADDACNPFYWTEGRFSEEVIRSANEAVGGLAAEGGFQKIELIGYSGGAAIAVLVAARRHDVAAIRTVAGDLDNGRLIRIHSLSPMEASLEPLDAAAGLGNIPQIHFVGESDKVVPLEVARSFVDKLPPGSSARIVTVPGASHGKGWAERWKNLLEE